MSFKRRFHGADGALSIPPPLSQKPSFLRTPSLYSNTSMAVRWRIGLDGNRSSRQARFDPERPLSFFRSFETLHDFNLTNSSSSFVFREDRGVAKYSLCPVELPNFCQVMLVGYQVWHIIRSSFARIIRVNFFYHPIDYFFCSRLIAFNKKYFGIYTPRFKYVRCFSDRMLNKSPCQSVITPKVFELSFSRRIE